MPASRVAAEFKRYLDQVYAAAKTGAVQLDGQNIFLYRPVADSRSEFEVEFGVGVKAPFAPVGNVQMSALPSGNAATTVHWGDYRELGKAHDAIREWCRANGTALAGPSWEIYGHWQEGVTPRTDVYYLVAP